MQLYTLDMLRDNFDTPTYELLEEKTLLSLLDQALPIQDNEAYEWLITIPELSNDPCYFLLVITAIIEYFVISNRDYAFLESLLDDAYAYVYEDASESL